KVSPHHLLEHVTLADKEIRAARRFQQNVSPFGVTGITKGLSFARHAIGQAGANLVVMTDVKWDDRQFVNPVERANFDLMECQFEWELAITGESRCEQAVEPIAQARRARDRQRACSLGNELRIKNEERHAAEMIEVEMSNKNDIDCIAV